MAEKGAYLTGTIHARPSLFEIVAHESLASTLEPAFKKIVSYLVLSNPARYKWLDRWFHEVYLVFNTGLQFHYLKKYSASFSEAFYGLKRVPLSHGASTQLSNKQEKISLLLLALFPYLRNKLTILAEKYKFDAVDGRVPKEKWRKFLRSMVIKGHVAFHMIYECSMLYNFLAYLSGWSRHPTPLLRLAAVTLTYSDAQKMLTIGELLKKMRSGTFNLDNGFDLFGRILTRSLELGAFFLQFLQWWNQENYYTNLTAFPTPPPPEIPKVAERYKGLCPLCRQARRIHTALPVSGYVFCYQCILLYVQKHGKCPITSYPAKEDDLVRLYVE